VVPSDPVHALRALHEARGLHLHARTAMLAGRENGSDVGWALDVLHPLAASSS